VADISKLDLLIESLRLLLEPLSVEPPAVSEVALAMIKHAGLTDVVRMALQASGTFLSVTDVLTRLNAVAYPLQRLDNPRAAIVVVLSRLVTSGEAERKGEGDESSFRWVATKNSLQALAGIGRYRAGEQTYAAGKPIASPPPPPGFDRKKTTMPPPGFDNQSPPPPPNAMTGPVPPPRIPDTTRKITVRPKPSSGENK
jgi:hypothetical protein